MGGGSFQNFELSSLAIFGYHWLSIATTHFVGNNRDFKVFYTLRMQDLFRSLKVHHWLPSVTIGCPRNRSFNLG